MLLYYRESTNSIGGGGEFDNSISFNEYCLELMLENEREWNNVQRELYSLNEGDGDKIKKKNIFINFIKKIINKIRELYDKLIGFIRNMLSKSKRNKTKKPQKTVAQANISVKNNDEPIDREREELLNRRNERKLLIQSFLAEEPFNRKSKIDEREIFDLGVKNIDEEYIGYDIDFEYINNILWKLTQDAYFDLNRDKYFIINAKNSGNHDPFMSRFLMSIRADYSTYKLEWVNNHSLVSELEKNIYGMEHDLFKNPNYNTYDKMENGYYNMNHLIRSITIDRDRMIKYLNKTMKNLNDTDADDEFIKDLKEVIDLCLNVTTMCLKAVPVLIRNTTIVYDRIIMKGAQVYIETD